MGAIKNCYIVGEEIAETLASHTDAEITMILRVAISVLNLSDDTLNTFAVELLFRDMEPHDD